MATNNPLTTLLQSVLSQPTAPFRETWVKRAVEGACRRRKIAVQEDATGNLWLNCSPKRPPSLLFVAHMDHPGMIIRRFERRGAKITATALWLGGGPKNIRGHRVKIFSDANALVILDGKVSGHKRGPRGPTEVTIDVRRTPLSESVCSAQGLKALGLWGACLWYSAVDRGVRLAGNHWMTKAADDLAGTCTLIEALKRARCPKTVGVLLTRAEESGFHGAVAALKSGALDFRKTLMISVETSAERPRASLGNGPILRAGDIASVFDPGLTGWMQSIAETMAIRSKKSQPTQRFLFQRQLMDGGACEATAFAAFGFRSAGLSLPLRNYHNIGPSDRPKPEEIHERDAERLVGFLVALMRAHRKSHLGDTQLRRLAFAERSKRIRASFTKHRRYFGGI